MSSYLAVVVVRHQFDKPVGGGAFFTQAQAPPQAAQAPQKWLSLTQTESLNHQ